MPSRAERERTQQRRALRLLADAPEGTTEALMMAHGFNSELLVDLCIAGLAIAKVERMIAGGRTVEVVRLKITEAGRQALTASGGTGRPLVRRRLWRRQRSYDYRGYTSFTVRDDRGAECDWRRQNWRFRRWQGRGA